MASRQIVRRAMRRCSRYRARSRNAGEALLQPRRQIDYCRRMVPTLCCLLLSAATIFAQVTPATELLARMAKGDREAAVALRRLGERAIPAFRAALADPSWWLLAGEKPRIWFADLLMELGPALAPTLGDVVEIYGCDALRSDSAGQVQLLRILRHVEPVSSEQAESVATVLWANRGNMDTEFFVTLWSITAPPPKNFAAALQDLQDVDPRHRVVAVRYLSRYAAQWSATERTQALAALRDASAAKLPRQFTVQFQADPGRVTMRCSMAVGEHDLALSSVLLQLGAEDATTLPALRQRLRHFDPSTRVEAVQAIGRLGAAAAVAVPDLVALAKWLTPEGCEAVTTLGMLGNREPRVLAVLRVAARSPDQQLQQRAVAALRQLGEGLR